MCVHYIDGIPVDRSGIGRTSAYRPLMKGPNMGEQRGLVIFTDGMDTYYVHAPKAGDIKTVAKMLENIKFNDPGEIAAEFIKQHREKYGTTKLTSGPRHPLRDTWEIEYRYIINTHDKTVNVQQSITFGKPPVQVFNGDTTNFYKWADVSRLLQDAIDKVVRFTYKGGTSTGERLVKLTSVDGTGNSTLLRGWDIKKSTADSPAYRTYRIGNIVGNVEVIG